MQQTYTEQTTTGWGQRIKNALVGLILGPILIIIAIYVLWSNESRSVKTETGLNEGKAQVVTVKSDSVDSGMEWKLVYVTGKVSIWKNPSDVLFGITEPAISLIRKVEMYQWDEKSKSTKTDNVGGSQTTKTTYTYNQIWSEHPIKSANFRDQTPDKINPTDWKYTSQTMNAEDVQVGEYFILPEILSKLSNQNTVSLVGKTILGISANIPSTESDGVPKPRLVLEWIDTSSEAVASPRPDPDITEVSVPTEVPVSDRAIGPDEVTPAPVEVTIPVDQVVNPNEAIVASGTLTPIVPTVVPTVRTLKVVDHVISYSKNPNVPEVGDLRITFYKIDPKELSVIGKQNSGKIERYTTKNGTEIGLVSPGIVSSDVLFQSALDSNILLTWGLRLLGLILIFFGIMLFLSILPILGVFLPILSGIIEIGTTLISLVGTIMIWGLTIAFAWIAARPLVGVIVLVVMFGCLYLVYFFRKKTDVVVAPPV